MNAVSCLAVGFPTAELQGLKMARPLELNVTAAADGYGEARSVLNERAPMAVAIYGTKDIPALKNFTEYVKAIPESPTVVIITEGNGEGAYADALVNPSRGCAYIPALKNFTEYVKAIPESPTVVIITEGNGEGAYADALVNPSRGCAYIADAIIEASGAEKSNKQIELKLSRERALDERIANIFISAGIPPHIKGYQFLREAVKQTVRIPEMINNITKELYPAVADKFATSPSKVERAIRHAIEVAWSRGKIENINNIYGIKIFGKGEKPTNGELIALIADKLMIEYS